MSWFGKSTKQKLEERSAEMAIQKRMTEIKIERLDQQIKVYVKNRNLPKANEFIISKRHLQTHLHMMTSATQQHSQMANSLQSLEVSKLTADLMNEQTKLAKSLGKDLKPTKIMKQTQKYGRTMVDMNKAASVMNHSLKVANEMMEDSMPENDGGSGGLDGGEELTFDESVAQELSMLMEAQDLDDSFSIPTSKPKVYEEGEDEEQNRKERKSQKVVQPITSQQPNNQSSHPKRPSSPTPPNIQRSQAQAIIYSQPRSSSYQRVRNNNTKSSDDDDDFDEESKYDSTTKIVVEEPQKIISTPSTTTSTTIPTSTSTSTPTTTPTPTPTSTSRNTYVPPTPKPIFQ